MDTGHHKLHTTYDTVVTKYCIGFCPQAMLVGWPPACLTFEKKSFDVDADYAQTTPTHSVGQTLYVGSAFQAALREITCDGIMQW